MNMIRRFVEANRRLSYSWGSSFFDEPDASAYMSHPFSWMWLLVPISGILFFCGVGQEASLERRRREIDRRWKVLEAKGYRRGER